MITDSRAATAADVTDDELLAAMQEHAPCGWRLHLVLRPDGSTLFWQACRVRSGQGETLLEDTAGHLSAALTAPPPRRDRAGCVGRW
ncbi:hypothetical protein [Allonocardiopsis opalescens]|uniref:Uncharacterized protein n=1 Tax=Allonocardiopsis opalescens TaxID=1144618 RepID=A0A2T0Q5N6_9ACTN|nr:hypothetical protein [Allonocardiopsis opalescens]PRX99125.1 hypothetical protein CLV72_104705 [Allonocardiopsis opalescens]